LLGALAVKQPSGATKAALILDELNLRADSVGDDHVKPLLSALFRVADQLDVTSDAAKGFAIGDNSLRIHWLLRRLTFERFDITARSAIFMAACQTAGLGWLLDFTNSALEDYHPREGRQPEPEEGCLTTELDAGRLRAQALAQIHEAAESGELLKHSKLGYLLYRWRDLTEDNGAEVRRWTAAQLEHDDRIAEFARAFTSDSWSQTAGDAVSRRIIRANVASLELILDKVRLRARVEELAGSEALPNAETQVISEFLEAWRREEQNRRHGSSR
jgi:hypothetical protein